MLPTRGQAELDQPDYQYWYALVQDTSRVGWPAENAASNPPAAMASSPIVSNSSGTPHYRYHRASILYL